MKKGKSIITVLCILVMLSATAALATAQQPPTPFHVYGWVKYSNGTAVLGPNVNITNLNTSEEYTVETNASSNYYQVIMSSCNVSASDVLNFSASDNGNSTNRTVTVTPGNVTEGGLFEQNLTIPSGEQPDLVISDVWVNWTEGVGCDCTICYNITNIGVGPAGANHNTTLYVDGNEKAYDIVPVTLAPNESAIRCFKNYTWQYTHDDDGDGIADGDNITVCADKNGIVGESDEGNNCMVGGAWAEQVPTDRWICGDVDGDGNPAWMSDVFATFDGNIRTTYWAADADCDGHAAWMSDVFAIFDGNLNCCCKK